MHTTSRRRVAGLLFSAIALSTFAWAGATAQAAQASTTWQGSVAATSVEALHPAQCADYLLLGIRGSGESDANRTLYTFGNTVQRVRDLLHEDLDAAGSAATVRQVYVDYDAKPLQVLANDLWNGKSTYEKGSDYFAQSVDGFNKAERVLTASLSCPNERWIVVGYSQGAIIADWLQKYDDLDGRWAGVFTVADPDNYSGRASTGLGTAFADGRQLTGIYARLYSDQIDLPSDLAPITYTYCTSGDIVCDFVPGNGLSTHGAYGSDPGLPDAVGAFAQGLLAK